jgi:NAD(P)-dependent dehydrogenase (short-subunit alcohol dehydrogenase family)
LKRWRNKRCKCASACHRTGNAEDVARAVAYLAHEDYITGTVIHTNGGEHLW